MKRTNEGRPPELIGLLPAVLRRVGDVESALVRRLCRVTIRSSGLNTHAFDAGPTIIAANHRSLIDTPLLRHVLPPRVRDCTVTIGARDFFAPSASDRGVRRVLRTMLCAYVVGTYQVCLIGRGDDMGDGVDRISALLQAGWHVILLPEGTRARTGELGRFRSGVAHLARENGARVLPVGLLDSDRLMPVGGHWIHGGTVTVRAGDPLTVQPGESTSAFLDRLRAAISGLLVP